ncbi:hypothetical protein T459_27984 [Capsicum annuum]|uniref:Uncharacterized protein n=1 Tax=Capsicum annuum TaxID=4072 RepID=A0A2G2YFI6_CAPAN|nr:hypothetical protein T459_27984 [Capsicum annuum]
MCLFSFRVCTYLLLSNAKILTISSIFRLLNILKLGCQSWSFCSFSQNIQICFWLSFQYLAYLICLERNIFDSLVILFMVAIVWIYALLLTVGGAYNGDPPRTQASCRTDHAGLIDGDPWIRVPYPFQQGAPSFNASKAFAMMMAKFVAFVEVLFFYLSDIEIFVKTVNTTLSYWRFFLLDNVVDSVE